MVRITLLNKEMADVPVPVVITGVKYGLLYNWYAATDVRNIAADGWEVPELTDFQTLVTFLGGNTVAGGKLKETGTTYWNTPNTGATNEVMFNGRGFGLRTTNGSFTGINQSGPMVSISVFIDNPYSLQLLYNSDDTVLNYNNFPDKEIGFGIRLIKTSTTLTHGQTGAYTGNDGKIYRTICIGTQEWLADNLAETKYRNGDAIPEVTDNAAWAALTTGALCAYNNDWSNVLL